MKISGTVRVDRRTKNLVKRMQPGEIAVIIHEDIDAVAADDLVERKVAAVLNCCKSISGKYVNRGPYALQRAGILLIDDIGEDILDHVTEGDRIEISGDVITKGGRQIGRGTEQNVSTLDAMIQTARENMEKEIEAFAENTLGYLKKEKYLLSRELRIGQLKLDFKGRHVLIVVRGPDYKNDLKALRQYIGEKRPVLIAVDGGADILLEYKLKPNYIVGDMDSVTDKALNCGAELVVHGYESGKAPGLERLNQMNLDAHVISTTGTSEDLALLLAFEHGAELIVLVGSHFSIEEFLGKGRGGMASTFLTRLKVGSALVDAKGVSKLYENRVRPILLLYLILAALFPVLITLLVTPTGALASQFIRIYKMLLNL